jgi:hypothetical protein
VYFTVNKKPSITCTVCQTVVAIPVIEGEKAAEGEQADDLDGPNKRPPIPCPSCATLLQPVAQ